MAKIRPRITSEEYEIVQQYRAIKEESNEMGIDHQDVKHGWLKSKNASLFFANPDFKNKNHKDFEILKQGIVEIVKDSAPKYPELKRNKCEDGHLLVIDIADLHIGKLSSVFETGEEYNQEIAVQRAKDGMQGILDKSKGFEIDMILFVAGNDILHTDNTRSTTTSGTPQDTDGMWYENFLKAKQLYIELLESLMSIAEVRVMYNPSNHDYTHGFFLMQLIEAYFSNCKHISFDVNLRHRKAYKYYNNLIGTTHGDGAKTDNLPILLATEFPLMWSTTERRYIYSHHLHHKVAKDYIGVTFEALRSPSGTDSWHHKNGYQYAPKAVEGFVHHKVHGQVARITHNF
jgi:hypothetical protein